MAKPTGRKNGRPTVMTQDTVNKLEEAFSRGLSVSNACIFANISKQTYYDYAEKTEGFIDRNQALQQKPLIKSIFIISDALEGGDLSTAKWYAERKAKDEYSLRQELTGKDGEVFELALKFGEPIDNKDKVDPSETGDNIVDDEQD